MTTADMKFPSITLSTGERVTLTYGQYRAVLQTNRQQEDRAAAYRTFHGSYADHQNTYAALYNGVLQRDWFHARARKYKSTLDAALHGNNIPPAVVENLISVTREGVEPFRRYHRLRRRVLGVDTYRLFDVFVPLVEHDVQYPYDEVDRWIVDSVIPLGREYQQQVRRAFDGALDRRLREHGQTERRVLCPSVRGASVHAAQLQRNPRGGLYAGARDGPLDAYAAVASGAAVRVCGYTIFVAEVPSTLNEALFLDFMLQRAESRQERTVLLQHAIDSITSTFYTQVLFADFELQAHRLVENDQPVTADTLNEIFRGLLRVYYGDALDEEAVSAVTWARIPHFFSTPYYVYQYATCFASTARLMQDLRAPDAARRGDAVDRYLSLLRAGGSDYPMTLLARAGIDLSQPDTVRAVAAELDGLVERLERELEIGPT